MMTSGSHHELGGVSTSFRGWLPQFLVHATAFLLASGFVVAISWIYITHERYFYFWDLANFHDMAVAKSLAFLDAPWRALLDIGHSLARNYNEIFTLPLVPIILIFGSSRVTFIVGLSVIYLLPLALAMGGLAVQLVRYNNKAPVFWSAVFVTLVMPIVWAVGLRGWPDAGGIFLIALAMGVYLQDVKFERWSQFVGIGVCVALAMLFRRHFAYAGVALLASIGFHGVINAIPDGRRSRKVFFAEVLRLVKRLALTAGVSLITMAILAPRFLFYLITRDYGVHESYIRSIGENLSFYASQFGWLSWFFAIAGLIGGIRTSVVRRPAAVFLILFGGISLFQWVLHVRQLGTQYNLHFMPFVVLGLTCCLWLAWCRLKQFGRVMTVGALVLFLLLNFTMALSAFPVPAQNLFGTVFSARYAPNVRADYDEIGRLVRYLRQTVRDKEPIYVVASSYDLNYDVLRHAERTFFANPKLVIPYTPEVDSRDSYDRAVKTLLQAQYVIVAEPFQHHLPPDQQRVVERVLTAFREHWKISEDFAPLPETFVLADGAIVRINRRIRPTSEETARLTLRAMKNGSPGAPYEPRPR